MRDMGELATRANKAERITTEELFAPEIAALPPLPSWQGKSREEYARDMKAYQSEVAKIRPKPVEWKAPPGPPSEKQLLDKVMAMRDPNRDPEERELPDIDLLGEPEPTQAEMAIAMEVEKKTAERIAERKAALAAPSYDVMEAISMKEEALARGASEEEAQEIKNMRIRGEIKPASYPFLRAILGWETFERVDKTAKQ